MVLVLACLASASCGYRWGLTYADDVGTVAVPLFKNQTFVSGVEVDFGDALAKEVQSATPWRVTTRDDADTTLTGIIRDARLNTLSITPETGLVQEQSLTYLIDFEWRDNRTGEILVERQNFQALSTFVPARGEDASAGERIELGSRAALEELAQRVVDELRSSW